MRLDQEPTRIIKDREHRTTSVVYMVRPDHFAFNIQTASTNTFQNQSAQLPGETTRQALAEFDGAVQTLRGAGINVIIGINNPEKITPDAIFPNNWFSTHEDGTLVLYPMLAENRRQERMADPNFADKLKKLGGFEIKQIKHFDLFEERGLFLEGTGSMVFDRKNKVAFAHASPRTSVDVLEYFCECMGFEPIVFHARSNEGQPIYHTNVVLSVGDGFAVICSDAISSEKEKDIVLSTLDDLEEEVVRVNRSQMEKFCANILHVGPPESPKIIMSTTAQKAFTPEQLVILSKYGEIVPIHIPTIEEVGGGSARCILAEIFPPNKIGFGFPKSASQVPAE